MRQQPRLGLFGGSFNPIHLGHLIMAEHARAQLDLDQVLFIPAGNPPHKGDHYLASTPDRRAMVRLAIAGNERFVASDLDIDHDEPSYTWRLLERVHGNYPDAELWFIMGGDSLADFHTWVRPDRILELTRLAVIDRPGVASNARALATVAGLPDRVDHIEAPLCAISSTEIRRRIGCDETIRYLIPDAVRTYIDRHGLYRTTFGSSSRQPGT